ncbi:unnamed protein product [Pieris brassicae]|uniref:HAUS augmin-like complex subunit 3 N-terminal domain-containing protein n=1 Tax=Pieris brassicae TaxID=7116 RepID=A0A9P0THT7_PIEBR|nr:unnamed protein product [Pieris brassicae]
MAQPSDITDEDYIPFLKSLGVETYNKSFEWMLNDPEISGVLRWIYENIDANNALSDREEFRYAELERTGQLLSSEELEMAILDLQNEFEGICLPGDQEALDDMKIDIKMEKERVDMLEKQDVILKDMMQRNKDIKKELNVEITKLQAAELQCTEDEANLGKDCLKLAKEVESITSDVITIVADTLDILSNCQDDKDSAKRFLAFGPIDQYHKSQALFRSHFDLYCTKRLKNPEFNIKEEEIMRAIIKAKNVESRLLDATSAYIESTVDLSGEKAKLALLANYTHPSANDVALYTMEVMSNIEMFEQEESIIEKQLQDAVKQFVRRRTMLVEESAAKIALNVRLQIKSDLKLLLSKTQEALTLDRLLYYALRRELASLEEVLQFASHLRGYVLQEEEAVSSRIQSMKEITNELDLSDSTNNLMLSSLCKILSVTDFKSLVPEYKEVKKKAKRLREEIVEAICEKERDLDKIKRSQAILYPYVWGGCTRAAACHSPEVSAMTHALAHQINSIDETIKNIGMQFTTVKHGEKHHLRKFWQWFLTDPVKFNAAIRRVY